MPSGIIDTFKVRIYQPVEQSTHYYMSKGEWGIKFEIVCSIGVPKIIWLSGPWKGSGHDASIAEVSGIKDLLSGSALLADKIYRGDSIAFICPHPGHTSSLTKEGQAYNYLVYSARQTIERMIKRMRIFGVLVVRWRYSLPFLGLCGKVVGKLVNLFLIYEPLG